MLNALNQTNKKACNKEPNCRPRALNSTAGTAED